MASSSTNSGSQSNILLNQILNTLQEIQRDYRVLSAAVDTINGRVNILSGVKQVQEAACPQPVADVHRPETPVAQNMSPDTKVLGHHPDPNVAVNGKGSPDGSTIPQSSRRPSITSRIILTTYPGQSGIDPIMMSWGHQNPTQRGPVVVTRSQSTIRRRNGMYPTD